MKKAIITILLTCLSLNSNAAQTDDNRIITTVSIEPGDQGYFRLASDFSLFCLHKVIYFDVSTPTGKGYLSLLPAAKMASK